MTPQQEHLITIGPWGFIGYFIAFVFAVLFARLWWSSRPTELRAMQKALREARQYIAVLEKERDEAQRENAAMRVQIAQLQKHYEDITRKVESLEKEKGNLRTHITSITDRLNKERDRSDEYYGRLVQLEARLNIQN